MKNQLDDYYDFLKKKSQLGVASGFNPTFLPATLFDFQKSLVTWAIKTGRAAIFADCGMGKTLMQLVWAQNVVEHTNKPVLILSPLSVSLQTKDEADKFNIQASRSSDGKFNGANIVLTNYERLHNFNHSDFAGVVCDESSCIKNFDGARKSEITEFMKKVKYRLLCTATAAPNDHIEFGTSSEALGYIGYMDMLSTFFKNDEDNLHPAFIGTKWRFKPHAENRFWRWMTSWARACRKPSDLGFEDKNFILPSLNIKEAWCKGVPLDGFLFALPAKGLNEQRENTKKTVEERCGIASDLLNNNESGIAWCNLNAESKLMTKMVNGAVEVSGEDCDDSKDEKFMAFKKGHIRILVSKPKIAAFGMNFQHCSDMTYFPTHSFEQYYQAVRRCWRYGQKNEVNVTMVASESQQGIFDNLKRKALACDNMFTLLVKHMNDAIKINRITTFENKETVPSWLLKKN